MKPEIREIDQMHVIGVKGKCKMATTMQDIPPLWNKLMERQDEIKDKIDKDIAYGINFMIDNDSFWCNACYEVKAGTEVPAEMELDSIQPMKVAVFTHTGKMVAMKDTYENIMKKWVPEAGVEIDWAKPSIEMYDERFKYDAEDSVCEIWMPLK